LDTCKVIYRTSVGAAVCLSRSVFVFVFWLNVTVLNLIPCSHYIRHTCFGVPTVSHSCNWTRSQ